MTRLALKFLTADDTGAYSNHPWPVPKNGKPGAWVACKGELVVCENGIHACALSQTFDWLNDNAYLIELGGRVIDADNKLCARKGRLVRKLDWNPRLFAADCAEHVLPIFEKEYPDDDRPRKAIEAARAYARGEIDAAAGDAAWDAAWDAAGDAAWAAAGGAAWAAARTAARTAAWAAAGDAAGDAAWDAAWDAAGDAAWAAAGGAARTAAWAAARAAERDWQLQTLTTHLHLTPDEIKAVV